jgi:hypothetical protein
MTFTIPPRLRWQWQASFYPPNLPEPALIDGYLDDSSRRKLDRYRELAAQQLALREELGRLDPNRAHQADEQARARAFASGQPAPPPTEPQVRGRIDELRATIKTADSVLLGALERAGNAILADQRGILDRIAADARADIPARLAELRDRLGADLDALFPLIAAAEWVRDIDVRPQHYASNQGRALAEAMLNQLLDQLDVRMDSAFVPVQPPEPSTGDIAEHFGTEAARGYGEQKRRRRSTGWKA